MRGGPSNTANANFGSTIRENTSANGSTGYSASYTRAGKCEQSVPLARTVARTKARVRAVTQAGAGMGARARSAARVIVATIAVGKRYVTLQLLKVFANL